MYETDEDLEELQLVLDESHAAGGGHLRSIFTDERRVTARQLSDLLVGVNVLSLATVTAECAPLVAPVDGLFFRGRFHFGSSPESVRWRHIRKRPHVSASHTRGEQLAVIVHGTARPLDLTGPEHAPFRRFLIEIYGGQWSDWGAGAAYARIEPRRLFTFSFTPTS